MAILRQHEMTLRQRPTPYRASFFTGAHYRNSSEGLPSGLSSPPRMLPFLKSFLKRPWQSRQMDPPQTDEMLNRQRGSLLVLMTLVRSPRVKKAASSAVLPRWSHDGFLNLLLPCVCCLQDRTYALKSIIYLSSLLDIKIFAYINSSNTKAFFIQPLHFHDNV